MNKKIENIDELEINECLDKLAKYCKNTDCYNCNNRIAKICGSLKNTLNVELEK